MVQDVTTGNLTKIPCELGKLPISKRLLMNASLVPRTKCLADVGCDHAYVSIYLVGIEIAQRSIAMDVNAGPLAKAAENIRAYGLDGRITTRLSDGLEKLLPGEAEVILIGGMGGPLMQEILLAHMEHVRSAKTLVLQPQSELEEFRHFLHNQGLCITREEMCLDEGKFYTAMQVTGVENPAMCETSASWHFRYGADLLARKHPVLKQFLQKEYEKKNVILEKLTQEMTERSAQRMRELKEEQKELQEVLAYLGEE